MKDQVINGPEKLLSSFAEAEIQGARQIFVKAFGKINSFMTDSVVSDVLAADLEKIFEPLCCTSFANEED